jgi:hypothetical protein
MFGDRLHPADEIALIAGRGFTQQDLERPLHRVIGVIAAERITARGSPQGALVTVNQLHSCPLAGRHRRFCGLPSSYGCEGLRFSQFPTACWSEPRCRQGTGASL